MSAPPDGDLTGRPRVRQASRLSASRLRTSASADRRCQVSPASWFRASCLGISAPRR